MIIKKEIIGRELSSGVSLVTFVNMRLYKEPSLGSKVVNVLRDSSNLVGVISSPSGWVKVVNSLSGQVGWVLKAHFIGANKKSNYLSEVVAHLETIEIQAIGREASHVSTPKLDDSYYSVSNY
jgi:hypothetical protein